MKVGQATWGKGGASGGELQECLLLHTSHIHQHVHTPGGLLAVPRLGLRVIHDLLPGVDRVLVPTEHGTDTGGWVMGQHLQIVNLNFLPSTLKTTVSLISGSLI